MFLPYQMGPASLWTVYDFGRRWQVSPAASGGRAIATIATVPQDELWLIDLVRVSSDEDEATAVSKALICLDTPDFDVSGTATGSYDVADQSSPIHAPGGSEILIVWDGMPNGKIGRAYVQWTVLKAGGS